MRSLSEFDSLTGKKVLVADDSEIITEVIAEAVGHLVVSVEKASNGVEALAKIMTIEFDFIVLDLEMPVMSGMELFRILMSVRPDLSGRIVFITGHFETEAVRAFVSRYGCPSILKPFMLEELFRAMLRH